MMMTMMIAMLGNGIKLKPGVSDSSGRLVSVCLERKVRTTATN